MAQFSRKECERRTDAAFAAGRYCVAKSYMAGATAMANLWFCKIVDGRCDVCGADKIGGEGCFSMLVHASCLPPDKIIEGEARGLERELEHERSRLAKQ